MNQQLLTENIPEEWRSQKDAFIAGWHNDKNISVLATLADQH